MSADEPCDAVIVAAAVVRDGLLLVQQRSFPEDVAGLWELPGGHVEPEERERDAVVRECREELGADVVVGRRVGDDVDLPNGRVLRVFAVTLRPGSPDPRPVEHRALRWLSEDELAGLHWLPADRALVPALRVLVLGEARSARRVRNL